MSARRPGLFYRFCRLVCRWTLRSFFRLKTWGIENVPPASEGGVLLASNHQSYLDPPLAACMIARESRFMARSSLFAFKPFDWLLRAVGAIPVHRGESDRAALRRAEEILKKGWLLTFFPEGTRSSDGRLGQIKPGVASLALRAGVPVLPCYIHGAFEAWPRTRRLPRPRAISVFYGMPIRAPGEEGLSRRKRAERLAREMQSALEELQRRAFEMSPLRTRSAPSARTGPPPSGGGAGRSPAEAVGQEDGPQCGAIRSGTGRHQPRERLDNGQP